jgi:hypothetical protein
VLCYTELTAAKYNREVLNSVEMGQVVEEDGRWKDDMVCEL